MAGFFDDTENTTSPVGNSFFADTEAEEVNAPDPNAGDFSTGVKRGLQNLQAMTYGAGALAGGGLKKLGAESAGRKLQDIGMEGYNRNIEEAKQYPAKHSFKDVYTGKAGVGGAVDWAQGTLGELVPSMVEAGVGAAIGSAIAPGPGTAVGGLAGRTLLKKGIEKSFQQALKQGLGGLTESEAKKQITKQAIKKLGGKVGIGAAVLPMESGGNYAGLLEEKGIDAPETALLFGALSTSLEFLGGNSKLVDTFVDALSKGSKGTVKKTAKELLTNIPQEALQEGGQELFSILNTVANTDEKLLTAENVEQIIESMGAGAIGGGAGAAVNAGFNSQAIEPGPGKTDQEIEIDRKATNILTQDKDQINISVKTLSDQLKANKELIGDYQKLDAKARELDVDPITLIDQITKENNHNQSLLDKINTGIADQNKLKQQEYEKLSPEEKAVRDTADKLNAQRIADAQKINDQIKIIDERSAIAIKQYQEEKDPAKKKTIADRVFKLRNEKNTLLDKQLIQKTNQAKDFSEPKKADELRQEKESFYNQLWPSAVNKDAYESAKTFEANAVQQEEMLQQILQEKDLQKRNKLQDTYNQMFQTFQRDAQESAQTFESADLSKFDQIVQAKDQDKLNKVLEDIVIEPDYQARQKLYNDMFNQPGVKDASTSAEVFANQSPDDITNQRKQELQKIMSQVTQESDPAIRQKLYDQMFLQPTVKDAQESAEVLSQQTTDEFNQSLISNLQQTMDMITQESNPDVRQKLYNQMFLQPGIKDAQNSAEVFAQEGLITQEGTPYKNRKVLENKIESLLSADDYTIIEVDDGFIGIKKYFPNAPNSSFKSEQQAKIFPQFKRKGGTNIFPQFQVGEDQTPDVSYDGEKDGLHYHTIQSGPAKGATFASLTNDPKDIAERLAITQQKFVDQSQTQIGENQEAINKVTLTDVKTAFPGQEVSQSPDGLIAIKFKNGKGLTINSIQNAGQGFIKYAIETGQMSKGQNILGVTIGNEILIDENFADNKTLWHENKHVLDNLGMITRAEDSLLNIEFNKLRKANKLEFALSTHEDAKQRMVENRANMFAQIMVNREAYRNTPFGKVIQRVMDFFKQLLSFGQQTISGLAREVESGKIYERQVNGETYQTTIPQFESEAKQWYSELEKTVSNFQQKQATPDQWKGMIKNVPGIKQEELDWVGLDEWLDEQTGKVTQADLLKFIQENNVQLEEVVKGKTSEKEIANKINDRLKSLGYKYEEGYDEEGFAEWYLLDSNNNVINDIPSQVNSIINSVHKDDTFEQPKYAEYQLPGGKNYKAILLTMLGESQKQVYEKYRQSMVNKYGLTFIADMTTDEFNEHEKLLTLANRHDANQPKDSYRSAHWEEPNILAHIRFNERTDAEGNKVLFLEEVQSDWHQEGRKKGYKNNIPEGIRIKKVETPNGIIYQVYDTQGTEDILIGKDWTEEAALENAGVKLNLKTVPDAPFKKSWAMLAMKRMVRYAAQNGFDKIAWTTGQQQADRYNLANQVDEVHYYKKPNGLYALKVKPIDATGANALRNIGNDLTAKQLQDHVGVEIANKIINDEGSGNGVFKIIAGLDLAVGGEGMKGFYDQMLPSMLNKEFNRGKWGKAKVEQIEVFENAGQLEDFFHEDPARLAKVQNLALPITDRMKSKALREGMPMFEMRNIPEQKLPEADYIAVRNEKNDLIKNLAQQARIKLTEIRLLADKALGSISTRLKLVDPELSEHLRWLDFRTSQKIIDTLKAAKPILDATKEMSPDDKSDWNWARLNSDEGKIAQLAQKYNLSENLTSLREKLNKIREEAIKVGYDVGFIDEYWPRVIKDQEGFLQATQEISQRPVFTEAIRAQAKKLGITQKQFEREFPEVKADIISNLILNQSSGIGGPGNIQSRVFETIDKDYAKFYMDADAALMQYVYSMTKKIEARKFFGKVPKRISDLKASKKRKQADLLKYEQLADMARAENPEALVEYEKRITELNEAIALIDEPLNLYKVQNNYTENIGAYIDGMMAEGRIQKKDEKMVRDILNARFNEHGTTGIVNAYKNLSYIDTMGSPMSAITQIGDLAWAMYVGKVWTPRGFSNTVKNLSNAIAGKSEITKEDLGIERIAQEFADGTTLSKAVNKVFKYVGLEKIDSIGKEVLINNALDQFKADAKANPEALAKLIRPIFKGKSLEVVQEILAYDPSNVNSNPSDNVKMLLYSRLLDFQPVALSEMPEFYLNSGNGRVFYMLKTYTLKQMDVFRREVVQNIKADNPQQKLQGITNMVQLMALLTIANAGADEIKDFMLGKETKFSDNVIENFLTMGGASRYTRMQITREGFGSAFAQQILPPMKFINSASKDIAQTYSDYVSGDVSTFDNARIIDSIPGIGKLLYWHYGRGSELKQSLDEQEFAKVGKDARLFKKQLENSQDKRLFIQTNLDRFKQMKLQENFQSALNRNKAVINKLEKIPSTENVQTRLGQLKAQREQILKKYFEAAKTI